MKYYGFFFHIIIYAPYLINWNYDDLSCLLRGAADVIFVFNMATLRACKSLPTHDLLPSQQGLNESTNTTQVSVKNKRRSYTKEDLLGINMKLKENQIFPIETQIFTNSDLINNEINFIKKNKKTIVTVAPQSTQVVVPCIGKGSLASSLVSCISDLIQKRDHADPTRPLLLSDILSMNNMANISIDETTGQKVLCTSNMTKKFGLSTSMKDLHKLDINHNEESLGESDQPSLVSSKSMQDLTKLHREKKKKKKVFRNSGESFEIDDKASEHSKKTKKKSRKSKHYCDIHGYKNRHTNEDIENNNEDNSLIVSVMITSSDSNKTDNTGDAVCTCRSKKVREEIEESNLKSHRECMNEYDSIIFNNEPLFSDLDDDPIQEEQVKSEMERYHKRTNQPDMFAAAQLINTNTTLKFAIITNELKNVNCSLKRVNSYLHAVSHLVYGVSNS